MSSSTVRAWAQRVVVVALGASSVVGCHRGEGAADGGAAVTSDAASLRPPPLTEKETALWALASDDDADPFERVFQHVGCPSAIERVNDPQVRMTAIHLLAFCPDFSPLPVLAEVARIGTDAEAAAALASASNLAAQPRPSVDPEDALELREGCDGLLALARDPKAKRERRLHAIPTLRMLSDRGCAKPSDLSELDLH